MHNRTLSLLGGTFLLLAASAGANAQTEQRPTYREREAALTEQYPDWIVRDGARLTLQIEGGEPVLFEDCPDCEDRPYYFAIDFLEPFDSYLVALLQYSGEDATFGLLERTTGSIRWLAAEPFPDPSGQRFVAVAEGGYWSPSIEIGLWTGFGFTMEVDQEIESSFSFGQWDGTERIELVCRGNCTAFLEWQDGRWHLIETVAIPLGVE